MKNQFEKVFDARHRRIRGLWIRNGIYYAQLRLDGTNRASRVPIQGAETVPQAIAGMQGLKHERANGELQLTPVRNVPTLAEVGAKFLANAKALGLLSERTRDIYQHSFKRFAEFGSDTPATKIDAVWVNRYQLFRAKKQVNGRPLKGRTIDIEMNALRCALKFAVEQRLIPRMPDWQAPRLGKAPARKRLLSEEEIQKVCSEARKLRYGTQLADYILLLAYSGMREKEGLRIRWEDVDWDHEGITVQPVVEIGDREERAKTQHGNGDVVTRFVHFNPLLKSHLIAMKARAVNSDWVFPSKTDHTLPADKKRNGLLAAIAKAAVKPFAWHHLRHYFISQAVMAGIDYRTIAEWVGHRDGGVLIGKVYSHLNSKHQERMASKLTFGQEQAAKAA